MSGAARRGAHEKKKKIKKEIYVHEYESGVIPVITVEAYP